MNSGIPDSKSYNSSSLSSIFEWMPVCALVIDLNGIIQEINELAIQFFGAITKEDFIFDKQNIANLIVDSHRATELIKQISTNSEATNKEILIRRFDKTIAGVDLQATIFPNNPNYILIQFFEKQPKSQIYIYQLSNAFRREIQRLKPYLNKPGRNILEEIIENELAESTIGKQISKKNQIVIISEELMKQLISMFPEFSNKELTLCGYLSLKISIDEISNLTGQTANSLRVLFHRILKKTNFSTGKDFLRKLESIN